MLPTSRPSKRVITSRSSSSKAIATPVCLSIHTMTELPSATTVSAPCSSPTKNSAHSMTFILSDHYRRMWSRHFARTSFRLNCTLYTPPGSEEISSIEGMCIASCRRTTCPSIFTTVSSDTPSTLCSETKFDAGLGYMLIICWVFSSALLLTLVIVVRKSPR
jgi:hypothetical protein